MIEVRWHGRGGQGAKTASYLLAESAMRKGKYIQAFPEYGPERMGAPIKAFTRISDEPIRRHCGVTSPSIVAVLDPTLMTVVDVFEGVPEDGVVVVNTEEDPAALRKSMNVKGRKLFTVPATRIAMDTIKRPIPNTPMIAAVVRATGLLDIEPVAEEVQKNLMKKLGPKVAEANVVALRRAYEEVKSE